MWISANRHRVGQHHPVLALLMCGFFSVATWGAPASAANPTTLPSVTTLAPLLEQARLGALVVALFSRTDCPWCEALRRDQLVHLARDARAQGLQVVEFEISDDRPFKPRALTAAGTAAHPVERAAPQLAPRTDTNLWGANSPSDLARHLGVRVVPTVVFLGPRGELAPRLVGYTSRDFYGAYLTQRIDEARALLISAGRP